MSKHTKGPWQVYQGQDYIQLTSENDGMKLAELRYPGPEDVANFHLMAAAPEMFEALKDWPSYNTTTSGAVERKVLAALAKARGEQDD